MRTNGLFSFHEDGHQECCRVRKVRPLRRAPKGLRAWITGQRKDQSPGTRSEVPVVQVNPSFEGLDGGAGSLVKWNPMANVQGTDILKLSPYHDIFNSQNVVCLSRPGIENLVKLEGRREPWLVVLYAPWCRFCHAMEGSYVELAEKLAGTGVKVQGRWGAKGIRRERITVGGASRQYFSSLRPKHSSRPVKYPSI